jgi:2-polyprenyl-3-methyl-5-hydroxy-6-metoxy-1,4-benzoquinol methylase
VQKQKLLDRIVKILGARSVLDVGSGDGQTASALPEYVAITAVDLAASSRPLYLSNLPRARWMQHDITKGPVAIDADLVLCLDVLIHLSSSQDYRAAVRNLLSRSVPVLISGFDAAPVDFGPMTYFHEPMSSTITENGYIPIPVDAYRGLTVFVAVPPRKALTTRDISDATLREALPLVTAPLVLFEAVTLSRSKLGFFPDHLPRCIEYPWIVQQLGGRGCLRIIDAGAGVSVLPLMLAEDGHVVITIDPHRLVRNGMPCESWNEWGFLDYSQIDERIESRRLPYQESTDDLRVDAVVSVSVIEHLPRPIRRAWLEKAGNQLVAGGLILLTVDTVPFTRELWNYSEGRQVEDQMVHGYIDDLTSELEEAGFRLELVEHSSWLPKSRVGMARIKATKSN